MWLHKTSKTIPHPKYRYRSWQNWGSVSYDARQMFLVLTQKEKMIQVLKNNIWENTSSYCLVFFVFHLKLWLQFVFHELPFSFLKKNAHKWNTFSKNQKIFTSLIEKSFEFKQFSLMHINKTSRIYVSMWNFQSCINLLSLGII